jgi:hypothetical protein
VTRLKFISKFISKFLLAAAVLIVIGACRSGPCRSDKPMPGEAISPSSLTHAEAGSDNKILVFKNDGSLQCGVARGMALEAMEKQLVGIKVSSKMKRADGLMHIQVCGQTSGMMNVYEIPETDLPTAEARGFKKLENN